MDDVTGGARRRKRPSEEESARRLDDLLPKFRDAAAAAIQSGQLDPAAFGMSRAQALDALSGGTAALESLDVFAPALEALVKTAGRPPLLVHNGKVRFKPIPEMPADIGVKITAVEPLVMSVGRVEFFNHGMPWGGTAWVLKKDAGGCTVVTNRHVARLVARRAADGTGVFLRSPVTGMRYGAAVDFNEEVEALPEDARAAKVLAIPYIAEDYAADAALMRIALPAGAAWALPDEVPLAEREGDRDELVAVVGYPARDGRSERSSEAIAALARYFGNDYDVKRFSPGVLTSGMADGLIRYDCTTLGGNSGSPVLSLDQKGAVGLHFAGTYGVENTAVSLATLKALKGSDGRTLSTGALLHSPEAAEARADAAHEAGFFEGRAGYDPAFLGGGLLAPWPRLPDAVAGGLATPSDAEAGRPHELRYTHFGVMYSAAIKLPVVTAVNIDGETSKSIKRGDDQWFFDLRIPRAVQHDARSFRDRKIDRGHMVRREDPNWGEEARQANDDTFHYVNSAPQHSDLNQGKTLWLGLENYILNSARTGGFRACVFTGPVLGDEDPDIDGIRTPLEFWKVVAMEDAQGKRLHATAYLLSQGQLIRKLLEDRDRSEAREGASLLGAYRTFQIMISDLAAATGYDFGPLTAADPLARRGELSEAIATGQPVVFALEALSDLVL
ncbi:DNA/RNA non-specific endonuclease [Xanthobacter sp. AM11]|uniref:DNA/RNA non-specific endonuclease n=1 Tax=Xanthobacter sp. AM11 TaxID=3380643 RepID=UPI0039BFF509